MDRQGWVVAVVVLAGCARAGEEVNEVDEPPASEAPAVVVEAHPAAVEAELEAPSEQAEVPAVFEPATRGQGTCEVSVVALHEAEAYRGPGPITPMLEASLNADPEFARMYQAEGHGDHHIQCHYEVHLAHLPGKRFTWREVHGNTLDEHSPEICKRDVAAVAEHIIESTKQCTDFAAGAYWGYVLEEFP